MVQFLGSHITAFSIRGSFGGEISLDVSLADIVYDGASCGGFQPPEIGSPVLFEYKDLSGYVSGSGAGADGHFFVDSNGDVTFFIDSAGSGYTDGAFAVYNRPCGVNLTLSTTGGAVTGYTLSGETTGQLPQGSFPITVYGKSPTADYDLLERDCFSFYGITDTYKKDNSTAGSPLYSVQLTNGAYILGGVELILNDYYGSVNAVPNLINVFGYLENSGGSTIASGVNLSHTGGFGQSEINSAGMSWDKIASTVTSIVNANPLLAGSYGKAISYNGYKYGISLDRLPPLPSYYRINNDNISLLDFISDVCSAGGHDFFIRLIEPTLELLEFGLHGMFEVVTISRIEQPLGNKIDEFISNTPCVISKNYGHELRKDVNSKFVVGANVEKIHFNYPFDGTGVLSNSGWNILDLLSPSGDNTFDGGYIDQDEYANDTVLPFFGTDKNNNVIIGVTPQSDPDEYLFNIDVSDMNLNITNFSDITSGSGEYLTSLSELRAAKKGRGSWEKFLEEKDNNRYIVTPIGGIATAYFKTSGTLTQNVLNTPDGDGLYHIPKFGYTELTKLEGLAVANTEYPLEDDRALSYPNSGQLNSYFLRATQLKILSGWNLSYPRLFEDDLWTKSQAQPVRYGKIYQDALDRIGMTMAEQGLLKGQQMQKAARHIDTSLGNFNDNKTDQLYKRLKGIADTYYNKKFMVTIPFIQAAFQPESNIIRMSQDVTNEGFLAEESWEDAYASGLIPDISGINTLLNDQNKFYPFVKFDNAVILNQSGQVVHMVYDFSEIGVNDKIFSAPTVHTSGNTVIRRTPSGGVVFTNTTESFYTYDCWIKCRVDEKPYFRDTQTLFGPRAVIEIPGSVKINRDGTGIYPSYAGGLIKPFDDSVNVGLLAGNTAITNDILTSTFDNVGGDDAHMHYGEEILYADVYAIPLRDKLTCYGPWYAIGADGKVAYEKNNDLNPWSYGGYSAMNSAGLARTQDGLTNQTFSEVGSVTIKGAPTVGFGDVLIVGGPYITDVSTSFGLDGTTTTYTFQSWSSHRTLSKLTGFSVERNKRISDTFRSIKSSYREGLQTGQFKNAGDFFNKVDNRFIDLNEYNKKDRPNTSHKIWGGQVGVFGSTVVTQPIYNAAAQAYTNYADKAFMSMDGLMTPFSTVEKSGWPSFITPATSGDVDVYSINPFPSGHRIEVMSYGSGVTADGLLRGLNEAPYSGDSVVPYRALGLRLPAVGVGWGFDVNGNAVPSGTGVNGFAPDYLSNPSGHKAGPIDLRWDEDRGVWGSVPTNIYLVKTTNLYTPACFSFEVDRSTTQSQYNRNAPTNRLAFSTSGTIHDPEYLAYTGNPLNIGCYEQLDYSNIEYPYYEAFIIRKTNDDSSISDADYNIWYEDCSDCGHVTNQCDGYTKHDSPSARKKVLIENPLRQSFNAGDLAFTVDTGKKKRISNSTFVGGSGAGASGHFTVDTTGTVTFSIDAAGSGYTFGAFAVYAKPCVGLTLTTTADAVTGYTLSGTTTNVLPTGSFAATIYPKNATADYDLLPIHWVLQAEFKSQQFVSHVECDNGILQSCTVKVQTQGFKSCENCGESTSLVNNFM